VKNRLAGDFHAFPADATSRQQVRRSLIARSKPKNFPCAMEYRKEIYFFTVLNRSELTSRMELRSSRRSARLHRRSRRTVLGRQGSLRRAPRALAPSAPFRQDCNRDGRLRRDELSASQPCHTDSARNLSLAHCGLPCHPQSRREK